MRRVSLSVLLILASAAAITLAAALPESILAGDAESYRLRMAEMFAGKLPYFDFAFEHLPGAIVPMAVAWLAGGAELRTYVLALAGFSTASLLAILSLLRRLEAMLDREGLALRWVLVTVPLLPFLLFRNDSWSVFLTVLGIWLAIAGRPRLSLVTLLTGVLSKLWTAVWLVPEWWRGYRRRSLALAAAALAGLAITLSPSVQSIQDPQGLHTETIMGSVIGFVRSLAGTDLGITTTATAYIEAPGWAAVINLLIGAGLAAWNLTRLREGFSWPGAWLLTGGLVGAGLIASPYLSTQYVAWLCPFVALERRLTHLLLAINIASLVLITTWHQLFEGSLWWWSLMMSRNLALIALAAGFAVARSKELRFSVDH